MIDRTEELLETLHPAIYRQALTLVVAARDASIPLVIISARRSPEANRDAGGSSRSLHLYGLAFDVAVADLQREHIPLEWWAALGEWAELNLGLFWGGRFLHRGAPDVNHFDARRYITSA